MELGTTFGTKGMHVMSGATPGDTPNSWWFDYAATDIEHVANRVGVKAGGGIGRLLLVKK